MRNEEAKVEDESKSKEEPKVAKISSRYIKLSKDNVPPFLSFVLFQHWVEKSNVFSSLFARDTTLRQVSKKSETKLSAPPLFSCSLSLSLISYYKKSLL